jgi:hypothetical protein
MGRACSTYGKRRGGYRILVGKPEGRNHLKDAGVGGRIILKWISEKLGGGARAGSIWPRTRTSGGLL